MTDSGAQLVHYVIEMQPRPNSPTGPVPHVHLVAFFTHSYGPHRMGPRGPVGGPGYIWGFWSGCFPEFEPYPISQHIVPITDISGWAQYVAKHGARSEQHYQRLRGLLPIGWHKIGRVWGKIGEWPEKSETHHLSRRAFFALRRFATRLLVAEARRSIPRLELRLAGSANEKQAAKNRRMLLQARRRVSYLKSRLKRSSARVGQVVPVSDWIDVSSLRRWLRDACVERERIDPETGEVTSIWFLDGEEAPPPPAPPFSQHFDATVPGGETGCR